MAAVPGCCWSDDDDDVVTDSAPLSFTSEISPDVTGAGSTGAAVVGVAAGVVVPVVGSGCLLFVAC